MVATPSEPAAEGPPKAALFCPHGGHAARIDGDWIVLEFPGYDSFRCPDCDGTVTRRPRFELRPR